MQLKREEKSLIDTKFGDCCLVDLNPVCGHEQGMLRTVIVISDDLYNKINASMRIVVPISTAAKYVENERWIKNPWILPVPENDFATKGTILANQVRTLDMSVRCQKVWGKLSRDDLEPTLKAVHFSVEAY
jgi:mRNA-degrading endonuclease toxin of MazEF toxin-antitoxin module